MGKRAQYEPGTFSWVDLATNDAAGAKRFYSELFGWEAEDVPVPDSAPYTMLRLDGDDVAALYEPGDGRPPHWFCYVAVEDADATATKARGLGATVMADPFDVMDAGRMAALADPTGAAFGIWQAGQSIGATRVNDPGCLTWCDLATPDPAAAQAFYEGLFGWTFETMDTGGGPPYAVISNRGNSQAGMRPTQDGEPPNWMPYFTVESVEGSLATSGRQPMFGPVEVPGGGRIAALTDPQDAVFALFEGHTDD